ncbi:family 10 glycosylhydrolase [Bacillus sp. H-16]|uniref:glycoside hydrolase family 10 protein n=1 Tax=Alteribacter salitolerans TaxID=2912333 RepID=UPI001963CE6E|nr:family 10 glycosylhydrolase [Alteribacter salitolerans]MBM7094848.1 family 10 glycosylhydrolase [Alteribacter salitolerans]
MKHVFRSMGLIGLLVIFLIGSLAPAAPMSAEASDQEDPFTRAFWVQAFEDGLKSPEQVDQLLADVEDANMNTIVAQVVRRHDAYFNSSYLPFTEDPNMTEGFDALQYLIDGAKDKGIDIHAWVVLGPMWHPIYGGAPEAEEHIYNQYGPDAPDNETWVTKDYNGVVANPMQPYLDFGHPDAREHAINMVKDIVSGYDVDGIHVDYIRYQEDGKGYNPTSLARFQEETGRTDRPLANDAEWIEWKTHQIDTLMKRIYLETMNLDMNVDVTAAVLSWGFDDPRENDFTDLDPVQRAHQNWEKWLQEGYLDFAYVMNYDPEATPGRGERYDQWIEYQKDLERTRGMIIGPALYLNSIPDSLKQIKRAIEPSPNGNIAEGVSPYVYNVWSNDNRPFADLLAALTVPNEDNDFEALFTEKVEPFPTPWKDEPVGHLLGSYSSDLSGEKVVVTRGVRGEEVAVGKIDGSGIAGFTDLEPGNYFVHVDGESTRVQVKKGSVTAFEQ